MACPQPFLKTFQPCLRAPRIQKSFSVPGQPYSVPVLGLVLTVLQLSWCQPPQSKAGGGIRVEKEFFPRFEDSEVKLEARGWPRPLTLGLLESLLLRGHLCREHPACPAQDSPHHFS